MSCAQGTASSCIGVQQREQMIAALHVENAEVEAQRREHAV